VEAREEGRNLRDNSNTPVVAPPRRAARGTIAFGLSGGGYPLLLAATFLMDARRLLATAVEKAGAGANFLGVLDHVNYLVLAEWLCIFEIARAADWTPVRASRVERAAGLAFALYAGFFVAPRSHLLTALLGVAIALKLWSAPSLRRLMAALALVSLQEAPSHDFFGISVNELCAALDASATHYLLLAIGFSNELAGTTIRLAGMRHAIQIVASCATTVPLFEVLAAFGVFAIAFSVRPDQRLYWRGGLLIFLVFLVNWSRMGIMATSRPAYEFWHNGDGKAVVALCYLILALGCARSLMRRRDGQECGDAQEARAPELTDSTGS
jgi:hypothetical protein